MVDNRRRARRGDQRPSSVFIKGRTFAYAFAAYLALALILVGSAHRPVAALMCLPPSIALFIWRRSLASSWNAFSWLCLGLAAWSALALLPLPMGIVQVLAPRSADLWQNSLSPLHEAGPGWAPLSLDSVSTWLEVTKWLGYAAVVTISSHIGRVRSLNPVLAAVWASAVLGAVLTILQASLGGESLLGLYEPMNKGGARAPTVLINPNNLAGYMNLGAFSGLALLSSRRSSLPKSVLGAGVAVCLASTVLSGSRGGVLFLLLGLLIVGSLALARLPAAREASVAFVRKGLPLVAVVLVGGVLALLGSQDALWRELFEDDLGKLEQLAFLRHAVSDYFLMGTGRGAFESVSALYVIPSTNTVWRYVENFALSWLIEWGVLVGGAALLTFAWLMRPARMKMKGFRPAQMAALGIVIVLLQNLVDVGLEIFGLTVAVFALVGGLEGSRPERNKAAVPSQRKAPIPLLVAVSAVLTISVVASLATGPDIFTYRKQLAAELEALQAESPTAVQNFNHRLRRDMRKRPAEPYLPLLGAIVALRSGADALPWAAAALDRGPHSGRAHLMAAYALHKKRALSQALMHLRLAVTYDVTLIHNVADAATAWTRDVNKLLQVAPHNKNGANVLLALSSRLPEKDWPFTKRQLLKEAFSRDGENHAVVFTYASARMADSKAGTQPCISEEGSEARCPLEDKEAIFQQTAQLISKMEEGRACEKLRLTADLLATQGKLEDALQSLQECSACPVPVPCAQLHVMLAQQSKEVKARSDAESRYISLACSDADSCANAEAWIGRLAQGRGDNLSAHLHLSRAAGRSSKPEYWLAAAQAAARAHRLLDAERAYERAKAQGLSDPAVEALISEARKKSLRDMLR